MYSSFYNLFIELSLQPTEGPCDLDGVSLTESHNECHCCPHCWYCQAEKMAKIKDQNNETVSARQRRYALFGTSNRQNLWIIINCYRCSFFPWQIDRTLEKRHRGAKRELCDMAFKKVLVFMSQDLDSLEPLAEISIEKAPSYIPYFNKDNI